MHRAHVARLSVYSVLGFSRLIWFVLEGLSIFVGYRSTALTRCVLKVPVRGDRDGRYKV